MTAVRSCKASPDPPGPGATPSLTSDAGIVIPDEDLPPVGAMQGAGGDVQDPFVPEVGQPGVVGARAFVDHVTRQVPAATVMICSSSTPR